MNLTEKDRYAIAEYVYSYNSDVLIKSDAITLIDVLYKHKLIDNPEEWKNRVDDVSGELYVILAVVIPENVGKAIMNEYYGRKEYGL